MSVIAELTVDSDEFLLGGIITDIPDLSVELERVVPSDERIMPYLWGYGSNLDAFETALERDSDIDTVTVLDRIAEGALYRIEWERSTERLVAGLSETNATVLEAHGDEEWQFRLRFEGDGDLSAFHRYCQANDISYRLDRVYPITNRIVDPIHGLTHEQQQALTTAADRGYFKVPRGIKMAELADDLGISEQATSERIRRGLDKILDVVLADAGSTDE